MAAGNQRKFLGDAVLTEAAGIAATNLTWIARISGVMHYF